MTIDIYVSPFDGGYLLVYPSGLMLKAIDPDEFHWKLSGAYTFDRNTLSNYKSLGEHNSFKDFQNSHPELFI